jgi:hypothetical protein
MLKLVHRRRSSATALRTAGHPASDEDEVANAANVPEPPCSETRAVRPWWVDDFIAIELFLRKGIYRDR